MATTEQRPIAWMRDAHEGVGDECLVVCWQGDPGAFPVFATFETVAARRQWAERLEAIEIVLIGNVEPTISDLALALQELAGIVGEDIAARAATSKAGA